MTTESILKNASFRIIEDKVGEHPIATSFTESMVSFETMPNIGDVLKNFCTSLARNHPFRANIIAKRVASKAAENSPLQIAAISEWERTFNLMSIRDIIQTADEHRRGDKDLEIEYLIILAEELPEGKFRESVLKKAEEKGDALAKKSGMSFELFSLPAHTLKASPTKSASQENLQNWLTQKAIKYLQTYLKEFGREDIESEMYCTSTRHILVDLTTSNSTEGNTALTLFKDLLAHIDQWEYDVKKSVILTHAGFLIQDAKAYGRNDLEQIGKELFGQYLKTWVQENQETALDYVNKKVPEEHANWDWLNEIPEVQALKSGSETSRGFTAPPTGKAVDGFETGSNDLTIK
jgi:hypothetical protein